MAARYSGRDMHITIVTTCHSRDGIVQCYPSWLSQKGIDFDIVVMAGPDIHRVNNPKITYLEWPDKVLNGACKAWNIAWKAAKGPLLYFCYSDMVLQDKHYIARMLNIYEPGDIINRQQHLGEFFDKGLYCYGFLTSKDLVEKSGGWDERQDGGYAFEDVTFMHSLIDAGGRLKILKPLPKELALRHVDHPRATEGPELTQRYAANKRIYNKRFKRTIWDMYDRGEFKVYEDTYKAI